jgi:hypothetical protein
MPRGHIPVISLRFRLKLSVVQFKDSRMEKGAQIPSIADCGVSSQLINVGASLTCLTHGCVDSIAPGYHGLATYFVLEPAHGRYQVQVCCCVRLTYLNLSYLTCYLLMMWCSATESLPTGDSDMYLSLYQNEASRNLPPQMLHTSDVVVSTSPNRPIETNWGSTQAFASQIRHCLSLPHPISGRSIMPWV